MLFAEWDETVVLECSKKDYVQLFMEATQQTSSENFIKVGKYINTNFLLFDLSQHYIIPETLTAFTDQSSVQYQADCVSDFRVFRTTSGLLSGRVQISRWTARHSTRIEGTRSVHSAVC